MNHILRHTSIFSPDKLLSFYQNLSLAPVSSTSHNYDPVKEIHLSNYFHHLRFELCLTLHFYIQNVSYLLFIICSFYLTLIISLFLEFFLFFQMHVSQALSSQRYDTTAFGIFLISVHNGEPYLEEALSSILCQSYSNYEVVLVDDASEHILLLSHLRTCSLSFNQCPLYGLTHSRIGTNLCSEKWIARLDAYFARPTVFPTRYSWLLLLVMSVSLALLFILSTNWLIFLLDSTIYFSEIVRNLLSVKSFFPHSSALIRVSIDVGGYNPNFKYAQDYDLWLRISTKYQISQSPTSCINPYTSSPFIETEQGF